jgi:hypothetical protein
LQKHDVGTRKVFVRVVNGLVRPQLKTPSKPITYNVPNFEANIFNSMKMLGLCGWRSVSSTEFTNSVDRFHDKYFMTIV